MIPANHNPLGLYVHVPWCVKKCPYCDFNSHEDNQADFKAYTDKLIKDLRGQAQLAAGRQVTTVFFGGGTPSLMPAQLLKKLMAEIKAQLNCAGTMEVTLEANPGTTEHAPFQDYLEAGINRLSFGVQSFSDQKLKSLGRIHSAAEAKDAVHAAKRAGFKRINVDLMHGLPNQTESEALQDLEQAFELQVEHVSWYQLTLEPNTVFYSKPPTLPVLDELDQIQEAGEALLGAQGYKRYEVSAWAKTLGAECRHNLTYWGFGDYLALGAGAHGKITDAKAVHRFHWAKQPAGFLKQDQPKFSAVAADELGFEFMLNALRLRNGVPTSSFYELTGQSLECIKPKLDALVAKKLIHPYEQRLACTELGFRFVNQVLCEFVD